MPDAKTEATAAPAMAVAAVRAMRECSAHRERQQVARRSKAREAHSITTGRTYDSRVRSWQVRR